ncbi:hypothetical protein [Nocardia sp. NBC_00403]|uniref:hypothetical protein n=1 Tax=Nocardia sp. NBC_00403 TaxID=2975990 RepID=UPI002E1C9A90
MLSRCNTILFVGILGSAALGTAPATASAQPLDIAAKSCGFEFTWSTPMVTSPQITALGFAQCDAPPDEHTLTLALEYDNHGRWENAAYRTDRSIPPGPPNYTSYETSAACYAGKWRMSVSILGNLRGTPFAFSDHSQPREVPSSQCPSR